MERTIIDADKKGLKLNLRELWSYRDLFLILAWRDIRIRYAQTFLGILWAAIQPLVTLLIFVVIFGKALNVDTGDIPYPVFALTGMLGWSYFSFVLSQSGTSLIISQEMIKKIYFPRLVLPLSKAVTGFVDFLITLLFLIVLMVIYKVPISSNFWVLPIVFLLNVLAGLGVGIWTSALTIRFRDFQHVIPFVVQLGLYASPVAYPVSLVPEKYQTLYHLNPMVGVIEGYRYAILGINNIGSNTWISLSVILLLFVTSLFYFRKVERVMADLV